MCSATGGCVAAVPADPPGLFGGAAAASSDGGGGGGDPPKDWEGILAELICIYIHVY